MDPLGTGDPIRLGPYRLLGVLGAGGMGKVYMGQDSAGGLAAVKVLRPELAHDTDLAQRFVREAQAAQAVRSSGVAAVLGALTEAARPWIATEFLAGVTLDHAVDTYGPLDEPALRALAASLARTLGDIHAAGFIHRDLKPPNIVLTSAGPRVIDFGIARPEHGLTLTSTGQVPVTPGYGAPEQVLGRRVAPSADVFSLGAVLVYAATGRRAFDGGHVAELQYQVVHGEPLLDGIEPRLRELIAPCLAKDPAARPTPPQIVQAMSAPKGADRVWRKGKLADAIKQREADSRELTSQAALTSSGATPPVTRRRLLTGLVTTGAVLAAGGGATAWWIGSREGVDTTDPFDIPPAVPTPEEPLLTVDPEATDLSKPATIWSLHDEADPFSPTLLPVRDVVVFGAASGGIAAYDVKDGTQRWSAPDIRLKSGYLSLSDRLVAGADEKGVLRTYVPSTGEARWTCPEAEAKSLLAADDEAVYVVTQDDRLRSVRRTDAKVAWTVNLPGDFRKKLNEYAVVARGRLVLPTTDGNVLVVRTGDGRPMWRRTDRVGVSVRPAIENDVVYLNGRTLDACRLSDGTVLWSTKLGPSVDAADQWGPPVVTDGAVYAVGDAYPRRLDKSNGAEVWRGDRDAYVASPLLVQANSVWSVVAEKDPEDELAITTVTATEGKSVWRYIVSPLFQYRLRMAADGNRVFYLSDSAVYALTCF
ncbi:PQQ-binding-like beta-propeller repeat protein [Streptomyces sp. SID5910]|uniref:protein kinase domain-containing protein n=1 Tax=Streptomyces sp. SID5910 TaxID=2690312 RepID=UPI00136B2CD7|nr:PQQ-binding-like beta-propeller repeat protein [Streptomyces sp. SID5910]MYR44160.1 PQQ-binding-like beta-propeller repeat protein [Streptomyces sp. SID5910]